MVTAVFTVLTSDEQANVLQQCFKPSNTALLIEVKPHSYTVNAVI